MSLKNLWIDCLITWIGPAWYQALGQIVQIIRSPSIDDIIEGQIGGVAWLDSVDHLLEKDEDGSRTEAFSGIEIITDRLFQSP